jgi:hypothetical protein
MALAALEAVLFDDSPNLVNRWVELFGGPLVVFLVCHRHRLKYREVRRA